MKCFWRPRTFSRWKTPKLVFPSTPWAAPADAMSEKIISELKAKMFALWEDSVRCLSCQGETLHDGANVCWVYCLTNTEIWNLVRRPRHNRLPLSLWTLLSFCALTVLQNIVLAMQLYQSWPFGEGHVSWVVSVSLGTTWVSFRFNPGTSGDHLGET